MFRSALDLSRIRPLDKALWAGAVDNLGGDVLAWIVSTMQQGGTIASIGLAASPSLKTTVMPFILRGACLLGIDSGYIGEPYRSGVWQRLAGDLRPQHLQQMTRTIAFDELPGSSTTSSRAVRTAASSSILLAPELQPPDRDRSRGSMDDPNQRPRILIVDESRMAARTLIKRIRDHYELREEARRRSGWQALVLDHSIQPGDLRAVAADARRRRSAGQGALVATGPPAADTGADDRRRQRAGQPAGQSALGASDFISRESAQRTAGAHRLAAAAWPEGQNEISETGGDAQHPTPGYRRASTSKCRQPRRWRMRFGMTLRQAS
jgi:hypothetical protein